MFGPKTWLTLVEVSGLRCGVGASSWDSGFVPPGKEGDAERLRQPLPSAREPKASLSPLGMIGREQLGPDPCPPRASAFLVCPLGCSFCHQKPPKRSEIGGLQLMDGDLLNMCIYP